MSEIKFLIVPLVSVVLAQIIKFVIESIQGKILKWERLLNGNGGMPSSHVSFTFSLAMAVGFTEGFNTPIFAVALIFSMIVGYDAMGLRMESGKQAEAINTLVDMLKHKDFKEIKRLKEQIGHKPLEVLMGSILGAIVAFVFVKIIF